MGESNTVVSASTLFRHLQFSIALTHRIMLPVWTNLTYKILDWSKFKAYCRQNKYDLKLKFVSENILVICKDFLILRSMINFVS